MLPVVTAVMTTQLMPTASGPSCAPPARLLVWDDPHPSRAAFLGMLEPKWDQLHPTSCQNIPQPSAVHPAALNPVPKVTLTLVMAG